MKLSSFVSESNFKSLVNHIAVEYYNNQEFRNELSYCNSDEIAGILMGLKMTMEVYATANNSDEFLVLLTGLAEFINQQVIDSSL